MNKSQAKANAQDYLESIANCRHVNLRDLDDPFVKAETIQVRFHNEYRLRICDNKGEWGGIYRIEGATFVLVHSPFGDASGQIISPCSFLHQVEEHFNIKPTPQVAD
jgi:hypothetical protein